VVQTQALGAEAWAPWWSVAVACSRGGIRCRTHGNPQAQHVWSTRAAPTTSGRSGSATNQPMAWSD